MAYNFNSYNQSSEKEFVKAYKFDETGKLALIDEDFTEDEFLDTSKNSKV